MDMGGLHFDRPFDHITPICVYEHIPMYDRVEINRTLEDLLVPGGKFSITFDYRNRPGRPRSTPPRTFDGSSWNPRGCLFGETGLSMTAAKATFCTLSSTVAVTRRDLWIWKKEAIRLGQLGAWQFPLVKWWNDYTFGALFQEKPV